MNTPAPPRPPLPILQGERCLLRALVPGDADSMRRHADDPAVARGMFGGFPSPYPEEAAVAWCGWEANSGMFGDVWGIEVDGAVAGCIGLIAQQGWLRCDAVAGYWLGQAFWRRGIVSDALRQVVDWAFAARPEFTRISADVLPGNAGSQGVLRRCGFVREGVRRRSAIKDGVVVDRELWALLKPAHPVRPADIDAALASTANTAMERS